MRVCDQLKADEEEEKVNGFSIEVSPMGSSTDGYYQVEKKVEKEKEPSHLNTNNTSGGFLVVSPDKLSVQYTNVHLHGHDVGVVQANHPAPSRRLVYYFESFVKNAGAKGQIAIGFTSQDFKMRRQPGWEANSYGYHGDDGFLYRGSGKGDSFGPSFTSGDTTGGGINYVSQDKNGKLVGTVSKEEVKGPLWPTVAVHSQNEEVNVNFGLQSFVFDVDAYVSEERLKQQMMIEKMSLPHNISHWIIRSYLLHYGYEETLQSFDLASKSTLPPIPLVQENGFDEQGVIYELNRRKTLRQLIISGDMDSTFSKLREWYPQILRNDMSNISFLLHCQKFIEFVQMVEVGMMFGVGGWWFLPERDGGVMMVAKMGSGWIEEAIAYERAQLKKFYGVPSVAPALQDSVASLAYEEPLKSPFGYLLGMEHRELVADAVNVMVLLTNPVLQDPRGNMHSLLENLLQQLTACFLERRAMNEDQGEAFQLHRFLRSASW